MYYAGCDVDGKVKIFKLVDGKCALVDVEEWCKVLDSYKVERGNLLGVKFCGIFAGGTMDSKIDGPSLGLEGPKVEDLRDVMTVIQGRLALLGEKRAKLTADLQKTVKDYEETCVILETLGKWRQAEANQNAQNNQKA